MEFWLVDGLVDELVDELVVLGGLIVVGGDGGLISDIVDHVNILFYFLISV